jgi:hypothetical protein
MKTVFSMANHVIKHQSMQSPSLKTQVSLLVRLRIYGQLGTRLAGIFSLSRYQKGATHA